MASGASMIEASVKTTMSSVASCSARFSAPALPLRPVSAMNVVRASACASMHSLVPSVDPSEMKQTRRRPG